MSDKKTAKTMATHLSPHSLPTKEYDLLDLLDRLESLVEDMDELAVTTRDEAEALIATVHARLDELDKR